MKRIFLLSIALIISITLIFIPGNKKPVPNLKYTKIEVDCSIPHLPYLCMEYEGIKHRMLLDLGMNLPLGMHPDVLEKIQQKHLVEESLVNGQQGGKFPCKFYLLPTVKMGQYIVKNVTVMEENLEFLRTCYYEETSSSDKEELHTFISTNFSGRIGWPFFKFTNLMLDLGQRRCIYLLNNLDQIKKGHKYNLDNFTKSSFEFTEYGILVPILTDLGLKRFLLDTGAMTTLRCDLDPLKRDLETNKEAQYYSSKTFQIGNFDFGKKDLRLAKMEGLPAADGILGFDFCLQPIYLDFQNQHIYIQIP